MVDVFREDPLISAIAPASLKEAIKAASRIIHSDLYKVTITNIYGTPHIDRNALDALLNQAGLFVIDRMRTMDLLNARACTISQYDCWRLYLNPLLLLEMKDQEREYEELECHPDWVSSKDMIGFQKPFREDGSIARREQFNALIRIQQLQRQKQEDQEEQQSKRVRVEEPSVLENNKLFLVILLVHECSRILNYTLSVVMTPCKAYSRNYSETGKFSAKFSDFGHMVERELFGFVVHHSVNMHFQAPFGVHRIIGCENERTVDGHVVCANSRLRALLAGEDMEITSATIHLQVIDEFLGKPVQCIVPGRTLSGVLIEDTGVDRSQSQEEDDSAEDITQLSRYAKA